MTCDENLQDVCGNEASQEIVEGPVRVQQLQRGHAQARGRRGDVRGRDLRLPDGGSILVQKPAVREVHINARLPIRPSLQSMPQLPSSTYLTSRMTLRSHAQQCCSDDEAVLTVIDIVRLIYMDT